MNTCRVGGVSYPNVMENVAGKEFGFELIIVVPKDGVRERMSQKRATGIWCLRQITCGAVMPMQCRRFPDVQGGLGIENRYKCKGSQTPAPPTRTDQLEYSCFSCLYTFTISGFFSGQTMNTFDLQTCWWMAIIIRSDGESGSLR